MIASRQTLLSVAALAAALGLGFAAARLTGPSAPAAAAPEEHHEGSAALEMDAARITAAGIRTETTVSGGLSAEVLSQATVGATPEGQAVLTARAAGSVARITKRLGDPVRQGEVIALVESREAAQIAADRSVAAAKVALARQTLSRERRLFEQKVSPRQDLERAEAEVAAAEAEARRAVAAAGAADVSADGRHVMVTSPIAGRITAMSASLGAFVEPQTELFRIADAASLQVEAPLAVADARRVRPGDPATLETPAGPLGAVVRSVTPGLSEETRSATAVLTVSAGAGRLQPGQLVRARIRPRSVQASQGIVVPDEAVQNVEGRDVVFVRTAKGFETTPVVVGQRNAGRAEIVSGIGPGTVIATANAFLLKAELGKGEGEEH